MDNTRYAGVASGLLRQARLLTGMTQTELADKAGVGQSDISAYETGKRQPTLPTLYRLLAAAGLEPRIRLAPVDDHDEVLRQWEQTRPAAERHEWHEQQRRFLGSRP